MFPNRIKLRTLSVLAVVSLYPTGMWPLIKWIFLFIDTCMFGLSGHSIRRSTLCPTCGVRYPLCVASGGVVTDSDRAWRCGQCKHCALRGEVTLDLNDISCCFGTSLIHITIITRSHSIFTVPRNIKQMKSIYVSVIGALFCQLSTVPLSEAKWIERRNTLIAWSTLTKQRTLRTQIYRNRTFIHLFFSTCKVTST